ncbi:uncharacterized protein LOC144657946 [Oculina patagonica]
MSADAKERLSRLLAIRGGHRGTLTRFEKEVHDLLKQPPNEVDVNRLEVIDKQLEGKLAKLDGLDKDIQSLCDLEKLEKEIEESENVTTRILDCRSRINVWKVKQQTTTSHNATEQTTPPISPTTSSFTQKQVKPRLPKLTLPRFKGDITRWNTFWDSFNSAIHSNTEISDVDKFSYLKSLLDGPASRAIQGLNLTNGNYTSAVELLKERFGKPQQIISAHMDELLKIHTANDKPHSLRIIYDKISVHTRGLASLGVSSKEYGSLLIPVIMSKLPSEIRIEIARKSSDDVWKIEELLEIIKKELEAREASEEIKASDFTRKPTLPNHTPYKIPGTPTSSTFLSNQGSQGGGKFTIRCAYCEEFHYSASCPNVVDPVKRKEILQRKHRCFICLKVGHRSSECQTTKTCRHCNKRHHQSICDHQGSPNQEISTTSIANDQSENSQVTTAATFRKQGTVLLQTATAVATNENGTKTTKARILFDSGSHRSYVTNDLKARLNLKSCKTEMLNLNTFGEQKYRKQTCDLVKIRLNKPGLNEEVEISALSFPVICSSLQSKVDINKFPQLETLQLADEFNDGNNNSIDVLIGSDHYWNIVHGETIRCESGPTAISSKLGWLLSGPGGESVGNATVSNLVITGERADHPFYTNEHDQQVNTLKDFWETESIGIKAEQVEESTGNSFIKDLSYDGKRYVVGLPWKEEREANPSEYQLSRNRLNSLHHKLRRDQELLKEYDKIIKEQLQLGIIEEVKPETDDKFSETVHYLPHHAVLRRDRETTKVRVVYDGSAKSPGNKYSLNDCLEVGPNLIPQLFDVLVKFRSDPIALTADIEKAFLMVSMNEASKDMLRFLWFKNPSEITPEVIQLRFCRLVFGLRPSSAILGSTIRHHLDSCEKLNPELSYVINLLRERLYVDDFLGGADSIKKAQEIYENSKEIMSKGGFNLRKWNSNSEEVLDIINSKDKSLASCTTKTDPTAEFSQDDESYAKSTVGPADNQGDKLVKVLGVNWNTKGDEFLFNFTELIKLANTLSVTKRSLLKISAKIFDPLGFLSPYVIRLKVMFQELCAEKIDWDQELHGNWLSKWNLFLSELESLNKIRIPRYYFIANAKPNSIELHGFSDASKQAYAAVVYLRSSYDDGRVAVRLLCSKTRVAPVKQQSIPRLELLGACILARLMNTVQDSLPEEIRKFYWTDSKTTLCWITNEKPWKQYVNHRVAEIRRLTSKEEWRHCPGSLNPADLPSRGMTGREMVNCSTWWEGPEFLQLPENDWPHGQSVTETNNDAWLELVKNPPEVTHVLTASEGKPASINLTEIIKCEEFSTRDTLLRVTAYVMRFINNARRKVKHKANSQDEIPEVRGNEQLCADEINLAETNWIRTIQANSFASEI